MTLYDYLIKETWEESAANDVEKAYCGDCPDYNRIEKVKDLIREQKWRFGDGYSIIKDIRAWESGKNIPEKSMRPTLEFTSPIEYVEI